MTVKPERHMHIRPAYDCIRVQPCVHGSERCSSGDRGGHGPNGQKLRRSRNEHPTRRREMNPESMYPDMPPDAAEYIAHFDAGSNMQVLGAKVWWMITAHRVLRVWPSRAAIDEQLALRKAEMHEDLRIHVARRRLGGGR